MDDEGKIIVLGRRERALLGCLLVHRQRVVSVESLVSELWTDAVPADAVGSLRVIVSRLRKALPDGGRVLRTEAPGYLAVVADPDLDSAEFEELVKAGRAACDSHDPSGAEATFEKALGLWTGDAYADVRGHPMLDAEASRLATLRSHVEEWRVEAALAAGRASAVLAEVDRLVTEHPDRERLRELQLLAYHRTGRRSEALAAFDDAARSLAVRGLEPSAGLRGLRDSILADEPAARVPLPRSAPSHEAVAGGASPAESPTSGGRDTLLLPLPIGLARELGAPLTGRDAELGQLLSAAAQAREGQSRAVVLFGDAGIGKTRLVAAAAQKLNNEGWLVLHGRCDDEAVLRYQPVAQALGALVDHVGQSELDRRVGEVDLGRLGSRFRRSGEPSHPADPAMEREELFERVADLFDALAAHQPVLFVVDDLHWADVATVRLLRHLLRRPWRAPVLVLGTCRPDTSERAAAVMDLVADLRREHAATSINLGGLPCSAVTELARAITGYAPAASTISLICEQTRGNAFLALELVRHLDNLGVLRPAESDEAATVLAKEDLPEGVRDLLDHLLRGLPDGSRAVLSVAAVAGTEFEADVVAEVCDLPVDDVVDLLTAAEASRLVSESVGSAGRYEFGHVLIREHLLRSMPALRRARTHRMMADVLTQRSAPAAVIARHHAEAGPAGDVAQALAMQEAAADEASTVLAFEAAAVHLESALSLVPRLDPVRGAELSSRLLAKVGDTWWQAGEMERADHWYGEAISVGRQTADGKLLASGVLGHCRTTPSASEGYAPSPDEKLVALTEEALAALEGEPALRAQLLCRLALTKYWTATLADREGMVEEAVALARASGDESALLDVLARRQLATWTTGDAALRLARSDEVLPLAVRLQSSYHEADCRIVRVLDLLELGDVPAGDRELARYVARADELRQPYFRWHSDFLAALRALMDGRFADAEQLSQRALDLAQHVGNSGPVALWGLQMLWSWREQGNVDLLSLALEGIDSVSGDLPAVGAARSWVAAELGDLETSRVHFEVLAAAGWENLRRDHTWLGCLALSSDVCIRLGDRAAAEGLYRTLLPHRSSNVLVWAAFNAGPVEYYLGRLALLIGNEEKAVTHLQEAERVTRTVGARALAARARVELARALLALGGTDSMTRARRLVDAGEKAASELGMAPLAASAAELRKRLAPEGETLRLGLLTPAQLRVARLAATGASNPEIAAVLHLSRHTVEAHMAAILRTLQLRSRRQLIAHRAEIDDASEEEPTDIVG